MTLIPRHWLPQIDSHHIPEFLEYLKEHGIQSVHVMVPVRNLKPIQAEINQDKVESIKKDPEILKKPVLITKEGFVYDGHHRLVAHEELGDEKMPAILCAGGLTEIVNLAHEFDKSYTKSVHEVTTYSRIEAIIAEELTAFLENDCGCSHEDDLDEADDPCWDNYKMVGTKKKGSKTVPNCVSK